MCTDADEDEGEATVEVAVLFGRMSELDKEAIRLQVEHDEKRPVRAVTEYSFHFGWGKP
jgi:hypothetical protein